MKIFYKAICLLLAFITLFTFVSCKPQSSDSNIGEDPSVDENGTTTKPPKEEIKYSDDILYEKASTEYVLVTPNDVTSLLSFAIKEFKMLFEEVSGCKISALSESSCSYSADAKYISIGKTTLLDEAKITLDDKDLGESGYMIKTVGKSIFMAGDTDYGTLCAVYGFFEDAFNMVIYASDEIYIEARESSGIPLWDKVFKATIDYRISPNYMLNYDKTYCYRMRMQTWASVMLPIDGKSMGNAFALLPKEDYLDAHRDWYNQDLTDLCYSNQEMWVQAVENLKKWILADENYTYDHIFLGQEDGCSWCNCDRCTEIINQHGGYSVATSIQYVNYVSDQITKWLADEKIDRTYKFGIFAYEITMNAPATIDKETGEVTPLIHTNDNVFVMFAPILCDYTVDFEHVNNQDVAENLKKWRTVTNNIYMWTHSTNFRHFLIDYPNWEVNFYQFLSDNNVKFLYEEGLSSPNTYNASSFINLRTFLQATLAIDGSLNKDELARDFINHYYKDASEYICQYFDELRDLHQYNFANNDLSGYIFFNLLQSKFWPRGTLLRWQGYIDEAFASIEHYKTEDADLYQKLYDRINKESISIRYLLISLYSSMYTDSELLAEKLSFKEDCDKYGIKRISNTIVTTDLWAQWGID